MNPTRLYPPNVACARVVAFDAEEGGCIGGYRQRIVVEDDRGPIGEGLGRGLQEDDEGRRG